MDVIIYTDGSSRGNPGEGAFACIIIMNGKVMEYGKYYENVTNNQMEMLGVIYGLKFVLQNCKEGETVSINSDSQYVVKGYNEWLDNWVKNNWKNSQKKEVLNIKLWKEMLECKLGVKYKNIKVTLNHVKGHSDNLYNNRADVICTSYATKKSVSFYKNSEDKYLDFLSEK